MPSPKQPKPLPRHAAFVPFLVVSLLIWILYRALFHFPVWFDESIGKAIFFGLPVWVYVNATKSKRVVNTFAFNKMKSGLLRGVAIGGVFGFVASILAVWQAGGVQAAPVFSSEYFWWEFMLALFTAFWETLFFFSWMMIVVQEKWSKWSLLRQVVTVAGIFLVFHLPNTLLRFSAEAVVYQIVLLSLFAVGQALIFSNWKNGYILTLSHAIWGMVLLIHFT
jgi:hypothetical protein